MRVSFSKRFQLLENAEAQQISKAENQVIGVLQESNTLSIREIANAIKLSPMAVYAALKKLIAKKLVCESQPVEAQAA